MPTRHRTDTRGLCGRYRVARAALLFWICCVPTVGAGQVATGSEQGVEREATQLRPDLHTPRELSLLGAGAGLFAIHALLPPIDRTVPTEGFDAAGIAWSLDRSTVGNQSVRADGVSDWTVNTLMVFPLAVGLLSARPGARWDNFGRSSLVYAETYLIALGITRVGKGLFGRARPYAYTPEGDRSSHASYDASNPRTFRSMPSGHSTTAWTGAALGLTEHLLRRPEASALERWGVGLLGGGLAGATSALRVEAGQHFPTDVVVGAGIGIAAGTLVPLLHLGERSLPSSAAMLHTIGGTIAGTLLGVIAARAY